MEYYGAADAGKVDLLKKRTISEGTSIAQSTTYDHKTLAGIQSISDANSKAIFYEYDEFNRLINIRNASSGGPIRASFCYNYAGQTVPCATIAPTGSIGATNLVLIAGSGPLPVTLLAFNAERTEDIADLTWATTSETNSERFDIERSRDGRHWDQQGSVGARGESNTELHYSFQDKKPEKGENLYRLKMVDVDGTFAYSHVRSVIFEANGEIALYPNPVTIGEKLNLLTNDLSIISSIQIYDTAGKLVLESGPAKEVDTYRLSSGLYMVQITFTDGSKSTHRVVKQ